MIEQAIGAHELNKTLQVWRPTRVADGQGGSEDVYAQVVGAGATVLAKVSQPAAAEQIEAQQAGTSMTMIVHMQPGVDVRRGDELREVDGDRLRVKYVIRPSNPVYLRADCEQIQSQGEQDPS